MWVFKRHQVTRIDEKYVAKAIPARFDRVERERKTQAVNALLRAKVGSDIKIIDHTMSFTQRGQIKHHLKMTMYITLTTATTTPTVDKTPIKGDTSPAIFNTFYHYVKQKTKSYQRHFRYRMLEYTWIKLQKRQPKTVQIK